MLLPVGRTELHLLQEWWRVVQLRDFTVWHVVKHCTTPQDATGAEATWLKGVSSN